MPDEPRRPPRTHLSADDLKTGLLGAGEYLRRNYTILDNLNVFPVPDGDTGTNMLVTFEAGLQEIDLSPWPKLSAFIERVMSRPSVQMAFKAEGLI